MFSHLLLFLTFLLFFTFVLPAFSDLAADRSALLGLQAAVGGQTWRWNTSSSPCSWRGVSCDNTTNRVTELRLPGAGLRGQLRLNSVGNLTELRVLSLRNNALSGELPSDLASSTRLREFHLQGNTFSGEIPGSFFSLTELTAVNLAGNNFSGEISSRFNNLTELRILYLENNQFTGAISDWSSLVSLRRFNVSFNPLTGAIPARLQTFSDQSFLGTSLCGKPLTPCPSSNGDSNKLSKGAIAGIAIGSFAALILILFASLIMWRTNRSQKVLPRRSPVPSPSNRNIDYSIQGEERPRPTAMKNNGGGDGLVFLGKDVEAFTLSELLSASAEVMGKGTVASTYKAYFESGIQVIVKRLKNVCVSEAEFRAKMEEFGAFDHQNLEPIRGYFYGREEKLLLYEYMPEGSLFTLLHGIGRNSRFLSFEIRARIAIGAASAIEYLHSIGPKSAHGNIKSANVFVTDDYVARVSEFGLTRLVSSISSLSGYRAPEVMDTRGASQKADVYGFGVLLLELLSGRDPDRILTEEGIELPNWVQSTVEEKGTSAVMDPDLLSYEESEDRVVELLLLALSCTSPSAEARPSAAELRRRLERICV